MVEVTGFAEALEGLFEGADGGPPKKSSPNNESPGFVWDFGGAGDFGGRARALGMSVVLGRTGGDTSSPKMSIVGAALGTGANGWLEEEEAR